MLSEAVALYHNLLAEPELAEASLTHLDQGLERAKLIFGGRRLSPYLRPHFVSEEDFARVRHVCETVWSAIEKVKDAAVADLSLLDELGLTEIERELAQIDPGYRAVSPTARPDSFLTEDVYVSSHEGRNFDPYIARRYAYAGNKEQTLRWLERASEVVGVTLPFVNVDPLYDFVRDDPRFKQVILRTGLPARP